MSSNESTVLVPSHVVQLQTACLHSNKHIGHVLVLVPLSGVKPLLPITTKWLLKVHDQCVDEYW